MAYGNTLLSRYLGYCKFSGQACTVILIDTGYLTVAECARGLERLGHQVHRISPGDDFIKRLLNLIVTVRPDFLMTVNHLGFDTEGRLTTLLTELGIPYASWYVDSPEYILGKDDVNVSAGCLVLSWERRYLGWLEDKGFTAPVYMPLATDPDIFRPAPVSGAMVGQIPVGFVGSSMCHAVRTWRDKTAPGLPDELKDQVITRQISDRRTPMKHILSAAGVDDQPDLEAALVWETTQQYRLGIVKALLPLGLVIFGDDGWHDLLAEASDIRPQVDYYRELPGVFCRTAVNVNATSMQMNSTINQRVFDAAACGAFLLTDRTPDMELFFDEGVESICYSCPEEAYEQAGYYLDRERERETIAAAARRRVLAEHTYGHRMAQVVQTMRERFA